MKITGKEKAWDEPDTIQLSGANESWGEVARCLAQRVEWHCSHLIPPEEERVAGGESPTLVLEINPSNARQRRDP